MCRFDSGLQSVSSSSVTEDITAARAKPKLVSLWACCVANQGLLYSGWLCLSEVWQNGLSYISKQHRAMLVQQRRGSRERGNEIPPPVSPFSDLWRVKCLPCKKNTPPPKNKSTLRESIPSGWAICLWKTTAFSSCQTRCRTVAKQANRRLSEAE